MMILLLSLMFVIFVLFGAITGRRRRLGIRRVNLSKRRLTVQGRKRTFGLYRPRGLVAAKQPCLIALHGGHGSGQSLANRTGLDRLADQAGFVILYPDARKQWEDGRPDTARDGNDLPFIEALIDYAVRLENVDPDRIWVMGTSNGGMFTLRLVTEIGHRFAAAVVAMAARPQATSGPKPSTPRVPILFIHGRADKIVPWAGGSIAKSAFAGRGGQILSIPETVAEWARHNGANKSSVRRFRSTEDGKQLSIFDYAGADAAAHVSLIAAEGVGHRLPHGMFAPDEGGPPIRFTSFIAGFLRRHARRIG